MRPRERYQANGPDRFGDTELIALLLGTGTTSHTALEIGTRLHERFGGLAGLMRAEVGELAQIPGMGPARAIRVHAALELGRRAATPREQGPPLRGPDDAWEALRHATHHPDEQLHALFLDRRRRVRAHRVLTRGSDRATVVDARQVYREAVRLGAAEVLIAHNHPSGDPWPSAQDVDVTRTVARAGQVVDIPLLDHLVLGHGSFVALSRLGHLPAWG